MIRSQAALAERNARGSAASRRKSKWALLARDGDGGHAQCYYCGGTLGFDTIERDRAIPGGSYALGNLRSAGSLCNKKRSDKPVWRAPHRGYCHPITMVFPRRAQ